MTRRPRQNHSPAFKAKVALAALKGDRAMSELSVQFDLHPNQINPPMATAHDAHTLRSCDIRDLAKQNEIPAPRRGRVCI